MNYTITPAQAQFPEYRARLNEEIESGESASLADLKARSIEHPLLNAYKCSLTGTPSGPYESWLDGYFYELTKRETCLSIGSGMGRVEKHLVETGKCEKFEEYDIYTGGSAESMDLNFIQLKPNHYDLILCHGVLHHLINLEHVLDQINKALKPDGVFICYEYIGPNRWEFSKATVASLKKNYRTLEVTPPNPKHVEGFESVRSADLDRIIQKTFAGSMYMGKYFGARYFPFVICVKFWGSPELEKAIAEDQDGAPCYFVGMFGKSTAPAVKATPWTDEETKQRLTRQTPWRIRLGKKFPILRTLKRALHS